VKHFRSPQRPKKNTLVAGKEKIFNALKEGRQLDRIYLQNNLSGKFTTEVLEFAASHQVPVNKVPLEKLNSFNAGEHGGCIAILSKVHYRNLQDVISFVVEKGEVPLFLLLDGITDIRNIGGIARTAYCMGVHALVIPDKGVGMLNEDAMLTSAGALEHISICRVNSLMKAVDELHMNGIKVLASEMEAKITVDAIDMKEPVAIVMGSEEKGIYPPLMKLCDEKFKIPMPGNFESLNVSVATGMILYEVSKQRKVKGEK
jgi:23S rRNA (guanosine2251-2'-O)-methyltransferase